MAALLHARHAGIYFMPKDTPIANIEEPMVR